MQPTVGIAELDSKGYTSDKVKISCVVCGKTEVCKWERNTTPGINFGRPRIHLPEDWKVILTYGTSKQDVVCDRCDIQEKHETLVKVNDKL